MTTVTRCPSCSTSFRVTEAQLQIANGAVRCGACLTVFAAADHFVAGDEVIVNEDIEESAGVDEWPAFLDAAAPVVGKIDDEFDPAHTTVEDAGDETYALDFEIDAAELVGAPAPAGAPRNVMWFAAAATMVVLLLLQVAWFNRDALAMHEGTRPLVDAACQWLACELPGYSDKAAIRARDLVVRSHPTVSRALMVDALIVNDAAFRQVFPVLEFRFSSIDDNLVAARRFAPEDYLRGELTGLRYIPAKTEVRVSFEVVDPGPTATNYSLEVR